jgi:hypothetical protein
MMTCDKNAFCPPVLLRYLVSSMESDFICNAIDVENSMKCRQKISNFFCIAYVFSALSIIISIIIKSILSLSQCKAASAAPEELEVVPVQAAPLPPIHNTLPLQHRTVLTAFYGSFIVFISGLTLAHLFNDFMPCILSNLVLTAINPVLCILMEKNIFNYGVDQVKSIFG